MQPLRSAADFSAAMRPILLVVCALRASHALQAPRLQCTTSLQTPRLHRASLRASPQAETEEAPTAQWLAGLAPAGAALGPVCDNFHLAAGVLGYRISNSAGRADWWGGATSSRPRRVPPLFALAALIWRHHAVGVHKGRRRNSRRRADGASRAPSRPSWRSTRSRRSSRRASRRRRKHSLVAPRAVALETNDPTLVSFGRWRRDGRRRRRSRSRCSAAAASSPSPSVTPTLMAAVLVGRGSPGILPAPLQAALLWRFVQPAAAGAAGWVRPQAPPPSSSRGGATPRRSLPRPLGHP